MKKKKKILSKQKANGIKPDVSKSVKDAEINKKEKQKSKGNWDLWYDPYEHWHL